MISCKCIFRCNGKKSQERSDEKLGEKMLDTVPEENVGDT